MSQPRSTIPDKSHATRPAAWLAHCLALIALSTATVQASTQSTPAASAAGSAAAPTNAGAAQGTRFAAVDAARLRNAASEPNEWFTSGRDGQGSYFSPLDQINSGNVSRLGFAWEYRLPTYRGLEATPLVVDGVMYTSSQAGAVFALDARTGEEIWNFDPAIELKYMRYACCDAINRGIALRDGLLYVASLSGRLFALDAATGKPKWSVDTLADHHRPYTLTGAPQLTQDLVVIGNSGADMTMGGVRGYVSAYDRRTGEFRWRFYTVPVLGEQHPAPEMAAAAKTWDPTRDPHILGGGTVWDGMAYDPDLDLIYIGTANPTPYDRHVRVRGGFDNLYASSIVAIHAAAGRMAWYYQTTPTGNWDYDATQKMILATLSIDGKPRRVLMQANKNGYFYVIDRKSGAVISAKPFSRVNWTKGMDAHFRPILDPRADYTHEVKLVYPPAPGAHSWEPMSFDPQTGLVYIPVFDAAEVIGLTRDVKAKATDDSFDGVFIIPGHDFDAKAAAAETGRNMPDFNPVDPKTGASVTRSLLKAWNPVTQSEVWSQPVSEDFESMEGGVMSTAGNLVFKGTSGGELRIYAADTGTLLHTIPTGTAMMAAPCTYQVDGVQYVAIMAGFGGDAMPSALPPKSAPAHYDNWGRILVFRLGGAREVPRTAERVVMPLPVPPPAEGSAADIAQGGELFSSHCSACHSGGLLPNLKRLEGGIADLAFFKRVVLEGLLAVGGMERFDDVLTPQQADQIHAYLIDQERQLYEAEHVHPEAEHARQQ